MTGSRLVRAAAFVLALAGAVRAGVFEVDGRKVRVVLEPDWPAAMVGEPLYLSLTIENLGSEDLFYGDGFTRNGLGRPDFIAVETVREGGAVVPVPDAGPCFGGAWGPRRLRPGERHARRLFLPHWARITEPGGYALTCRREYEFFEGAPAEARPTPVARLPVELSARIEVAPWDPAKVPALLDRWAWAVRGPSTDAVEEAVRVLCDLQDPHVIDLLNQGVSSGYYSVSLPCITALAKFEEDGALCGLKMAMRLEAAQLKDVADASTAAALLTNLRAAAAGALKESRHPDAPVLLRTFENDADGQVRLTVVHAAGARGDTEDLALLRRRLEDDHELVRGEAKRYLALLEAKAGGR